MNNSFKNTLNSMETQIGFIHHFPQLKYSIGELTDYVNNKLMRIIYFFKNTTKRKYMKKYKTFVKLSAKGKEFQKHLIGSTRVYQPNVAEIRNIVNIK